MPEPFTLPFGDGQNCSYPNGAASDSPLHFTGQPRDPETSLDNFGARYNDSTLGRFLTPDWSAQAEPVPYSKLDNPQSLNLYAYVLNNPVTSIDPDGHNTLRIPGWCGGEACSDDDQSGPLPPRPMHVHAWSPNLQCICTGPTPQPKSWAPGDPFPPDPSGLGPGWHPDPVHDPHGKSSDKRYVNENGDKVDWHKGIPGATGWEGKDHWHWVPSGKKQKEHYQPGDVVKATAAGAAAGAATGLLQVLVGTAPEWGPMVALAF